MVAFGIACDYRYLNSYTVGDAYLMPTIDEVLCNLARLVCTVLSLCFVFILHL